MNLTTLPYGWIVIIWFAVLGMCVGSFANLICYRWPIIRRLGKYEDGIKLQELLKKHGKFSLASPRSACPCCDTPVKVRYTVPVLGWLILKGRCGACGDRISWRYPAIELLFGVFFAAYVLVEGVWPAGLMSLPMMFIAFCFLSIRVQTGRFLAPLVWAYALAFGTQVLLTHLGFSAYA